MGLVLRPEFLAQGLFFCDPVAGHRPPPPPPRAPPPPPPPPAPPAPARVPLPPRRAGIKGLLTVPVLGATTPISSAVTISSLRSSPLSTCTFVSLFSPVRIFFSMRLSPSLTQIKAGVPVLGAESTCL